MIQFKVDQSKCTRCGQCVLDCPSRIIERTGAAAPFIRPENDGDCIRCQHCLAVCPAATISIFGRHPAGRMPLRAKYPGNAEGGGWKVKGFEQEGTEGTETEVHRTLPGEAAQGIRQLQQNDTPRHPGIQRFKNAGGGVRGDFGVKWGSRNRNALLFYQFGDDNRRYFLSPATGVLVSGFFSISFFGCSLS